MQINRGAWAAGYIGPAHSVGATCCAAANESYDWMPGRTTGITANGDARPNGDAYPTQWHTLAR